ncbi:hypothetical protein V5O48_015414 [Marasmius crinis-equi]|uniref:Uncharacterized protein n=1 Tax=Marasmius crinis-equi TaxID=585013 RepID=A0ABR3EUM3_9AGAR
MDFYATYDIGGPIAPNVSDGRRYRLQMLRAVSCARKLELDQLCAVLSRETPPLESIDSSHPSHELYNALNAITAVAGPIRRSSPAMLTQDNMLKKLWPLIASWTVFLLKSIVINGSPTTPKSIDFQTNVVFGCCMVSRLLEHTDPDHACRQTPFFIPTILHVILHLANISHPGFETMWSELSKVLECRESLVQFRSGVAQLRRVYDIPGLFTRLILSECHQGKEYIDSWILDSCLAFINHCLAYSPDLTRPLRAHNMVRWLTLILHRFASKQKSIRDGDLEVACPSLVHCCDWLEQAFLQDGLTWVEQVLDGRILGSMVRLVDLSKHPILRNENPKPDLEEPMTNVVEAIRPFLVYRSVVNRVLKEVRLVREAGLWEERRRDTFWEALRVLEKEAERMKELMRQFDSDQAASIQCCAYRKVSFELKFLFTRSVCSCSSFNSVIAKGQHPKNREKSNDAQAAKSRHVQKDANAGIGVTSPADIERSVNDFKRNVRVVLASPTAPPTLTASSSDTSSICSSRCTFLPPKRQARGPIADRP